MATAVRRLYENIFCLKVDNKPKIRKAPKCNSEKKNRKQAQPKYLELALGM